MFYMSRVFQLELKIFYNENRNFLVLDHDGPENSFSFVSIYFFSLDHVVAEFI